MTYVCDSCGQQYDPSRQSEFCDHRSPGAGLAPGLVQPPDHDRAHNVAQAEVDLVRLLNQEFARSRTEAVRNIQRKVWISRGEVLTPNGDVGGYGARLNVALPDDAPIAAKAILDHAVPSHIRGVPVWVDEWSAAPNYTISNSS
jgi:hypothetical protein